MIKNFTTTYGQLKNGMEIYIEGILFTIHDIRIENDNVVRFEGYVEPNHYLYNTGYNGGTYGAYSHVKCTVKK